MSNSQSQTSQTLLLIKYKNGQQKIEINSGNLFNLYELIDIK